jgi:alanine racemase
MYSDHFPARITVNLDNIMHNTMLVRDILQPETEIMGIVKGNAYGHGLLESAHAMLKGGATWLGVAKISEALQLRQYLDTDTVDCSHFGTRIFSWIYGPDAPYTEIVRADLDVSVSTVWEVEKFAAAAQALRTPGTNRAVRLHIKVDTGFGRNGFTRVGNEFDRALELIKHYEAEGLVKCEGVWTHLVRADEVGNSDAIRQTELQNALFQESVQQIQAAGLEPKYFHVANSAGVLHYPDTHYNLVRPGIILYGIAPNSDQNYLQTRGFKPAMKLEVQMNNVKQVLAGQGISYGHVYHTKSDTKIGIVPLGYADGILRSSGGTDNKLGAPVQYGNDIVHIVGRVCMDQFMIDLGRDTTAKAGDWVTLFGWQNNQPSVWQWAEAADTSAYEILSKTTPNAPIATLEAPQTGVIPRVQ